MFFCVCFDYVCGVVCVSSVFTMVGGFSRVYMGVACACLVDLCCVCGVCLCVCGEYCVFGFVCVSLVIL